MDESIQWLLLNADKISAFGLLLIFILALLKGWIVLGATHRACLADRDRFEAKVEAVAASNEEKIARLEARSEHHGRMR